MAKIISVLLIISIFSLIPKPVNADEVYYKSGNCNMMNDSIIRLYKATLNQSASEIDNNIYQSYSSGETSLYDLAKSIIIGRQFINIHGYLNDEEFIKYLYKTIGSSPDENFDINLKNLQKTTDRAALLLSFTESKQYVEKTQTEIPLAGYGKWYPKGTHWYCGNGKATLTTQNLTTNTFSDIFLTNRSESNYSVYKMYTESKNSSHLLFDDLLPSGYSTYHWDYHIKSNLNLENTIQIRTTNSTDWIIIFYSNSLGTKRNGWSDN